MMTEQLRADLAEALVKIAAFRLADETDAEWADSGAEHLLSIVLVALEAAEIRGAQRGRVEAADDIHEAVRRYSGSANPDQIRTRKAAHLAFAERIARGQMVETSAAYLRSAVVVTTNTTGERERVIPEKDLRKLL